MGYDPAGTWDWGTFFSGINLLSVGITAIATALTVATCGAASPLMAAVAAVTFSTGALTTVNGVAEVVEAGTGYNFVRDGIMGGDAEFYEEYKGINKTIAEFGTAMLGMYYGAKGGNVCFVAGMLIVTAFYHTDIENIKVGDLVWAYDEESGEIALKPVVNLFVNETNELIHIHAAGYIMYWSGLNAN